MFTAKDGGAGAKGAGTWSRLSGSRRSLWHDIKGSATKLDHKVLKEICETVDIPVVAIGGITEENVTELAGNGICGVAVISAVFGQPDIEQATKELKEKVEGMLK